MSGKHFVPLIVEHDEDPLVGRKALVTGGLDFHQITEAVAAPLERKPRPDGSPGQVRAPGGRRGRGKPKNFPFWKVPEDLLSGDPAKMK